MEALAMPIAEELAENSWGDAPPPRFEEQEMDIAAFALWQQASSPNPAADEDWLPAKEAR